MHRVLVTAHSTAVQALPFTADRSHKTKRTAEAGRPWHHAHNAYPWCKIVRPLPARPHRCAAHRLHSRHFACSTVLRVLKTLARPRAPYLPGRRSGARARPRTPGPRRLPEAVQGRTGPAGPPCSTSACSVPLGAAQQPRKRRYTVPGSRAAAAAVMRQTRQGSRPWGGRPRRGRHAKPVQQHRAAAPAEDSRWRRRRSGVCSCSAAHQHVLLLA